MRRTQYVEVEIDIDDVLSDIEDDELIEEIERRNLNGINVFSLQDIHYAAQRKDNQTISRIIEELIYQKLGRIVTIEL